MADIAVTAGELPAQRRDHLPRQQPHQPLRHNAPAPSVDSASATDRETRSGVRPMSLSDGRDHVPHSSMGPHPGTPPVSRVHSTGPTARPDDVHDRTHAHARLQAKASYLQQRATGTLGENVFNAHDLAAPGAPADYQQQPQPQPGPAPAAPAVQPHKPSSSSGSSRRMVGPYQLAKTIGAGSMGKVKVALDTRTNKRVAAKIIPLQQPDAPIYFPSRFDSTASRSARPDARGAGPVRLAPDGPIDPCAEPWRAWLMNLALESQPDLAAAANHSVHIQRKLRLLQPRERYTTKDREQRENKDIRIVREVAINRLLHHPHICMLHDVVVHPNHYYIFQELISGGQMLDYIISHGRLKEKHARKFARQIASAIDYCHHNSIVHRDLKIENILISANGNIKLIDFGLSNLYSPRSQLSTFCGSLYFAAPELLNAQPYTGPEVDLWSFGVVLYVLVCGKVPFDDQSMPALHAKIKRGHVEYPSWLSPECKHLLSRLLVVAHQRRATMGEIVRHPWMCKGYVESPIVNNYLPVRVPLISPEQIDHDVIHEMAQYIGFGFGSEDEIRIGLEAILTEDWYRAWLKDTLAPQIELVRTTLREQLRNAEKKPAVAAGSTLSLARQDARESSAATGPKLVTPPSLTLQQAGSSSGATLTNPADTSASVSAAAAAAGSLNHASLLASRERQGLLGTAATVGGAASSTPAPLGQADYVGQPEHLVGDSVRKRSSFWKRSSTFISGGLTRAGHRPVSEIHASTLSAHPGQPAEKNQPGQFRVLSSRIFNDGKNTSSSTESSASKEYPALPLSPHSPRMFVDPASGMVSIWKDGKLAPLDTDCAAIQQDYHDLVATDPLLSIYFLVKERREREANFSGRHLAVAPQSQQQPLARAAAPVVTSSLAPAAVHGAASSKHGRQDSSETWIKLERAPEPAANAHGKPRASAKEADARQSSTKNGQASHDLAAVLASEATGDADLSYDLKATTNSQAPKPSRASSASCAADGARDPAADQTAAAIEALSLHPRARGSTPLSTAGAAGALQAPGVQDSKKKRPNIFKRFSVIVKGARPSHKQPSIPLDPASRIIQIEGGESGYMEISLDDQGGRGDHGRNADDHQDDNKLQASGQRLEEPARAPTDLDVTSGRQRSNAGAERYSALDNIDENREYAHSEHIAGELASRSPAVAAAAAVEADGHLTSGVVAVPTGQLPNDAARQYLSELLSANQSPGHLSEEASVPTAKPWGPGIAGAQDTAPLAHAKSGHSPVCNLADHEDPRPSSRSDASYSLEDLGGASSMFTNSELDEAEASLQASSARHGELAADGREAGSPLSGKAALLDRARREIEGFDEHEGVGLLDQTPELSYRVAGQSSGPNFDAKKRRTRSSSNTVARVLSEIVREGSGGSNGNNRNGKRALRAGSGLHSRTTKGTTPLDAGAPNQAPPAKTIPRHNSTGAINSAGGSGYFEDLVVGGTQGAMQSVEAKRSDAASGVGFSRPDILRSHSHAPNARPQGFVLPERIAEVSEPPTPYEPWSDSALRQDADKVLRTEAFFASPKHADSVPAGNGGRGGPSNGLGGTAAAGQQTSGTGMVEFKLSPDLDLPAPYDTSDTSDLGNIASAPPRADEHLKPVFLKGLFSVSTTSTRSPTAIRDNLLGVLSDMPLRFHEGKGYFTCSMATTTGPGNLQGDALGSLAQDDMTTSLSSGLHKPKRSLRLPVVDRKISFRRRPKPSDKVPLAPAAHISTRLAATRDDMSSNEENLSVSHHSVADLSSDDAKDHRCQPATETATETVVPFAQSATKSANCNAICFQIFLVRMPLLGLCGLQFRRVSGPTWKYKDLCSEILKRLKL